MESSSYRKHDRHNFFKYMSADTAAIVLKNMTLRWSSPLEFNDPYDVPRELAFGIEPNEILEETLKYLMGLVRNPSRKTDHLLPILQQLVDISRQADPKKVKEDFSALEAETAKHVRMSQALETLEELRAMWRKLIPEFRILCLCECKSTVSMWYHYSNKYSGVVVELSCNDESDSPWLVAEKINYPETAPEIFTPTGWAKLIAMPVRVAINKILHAYTYTKTPDWSYEKEWRVTSFKRSHETGTISDYKVNPRDFVAVYLGPLIESVDENRIVNILKKKLPHLKAYKAIFGMNRRLKFNPIE